MGGSYDALFVTGFMPTELMTGQAPIMSTETAIATWTVLLWKEEMSREELLAVRCRVTTRVRGETRRDHRGLEPKSG